MKLTRCDAGYADAVRNGWEGDDEIINKDETRTKKKRPLSVCEYCYIYSSSSSSFYFYFLFFPCCCMLYPQDMYSVFVNKEG